MLVHASLHGGKAFVPGDIQSVFTDVMDYPSGWYPMSVGKIHKEDKVKLYNKLKRHPDWSSLSKPQKMCAKRYIKKIRDLTMPKRTVCEAIVQAKRVQNEI